MEKKMKINYVDVIIILLVLAVFVVGIRFVKKGVTSTNQYPEVSFTVEVKEVPEEYKDNFKVGDKVRDAVKGDNLGVVTEVKSTPATELVEKANDGTYSLAEYNGRNDVYITIKGTPTAFEPDIIIAQQEIKVGKVIYIKNTGAVGRGYIVEMEIDGQEAKAND